MRRKIAERYRRETCLGMVDIATLLGYSEYGTFTHCALRWTGKAPQYHRQSQRNDWLSELALSDLRHGRADCMPRCH